MESENKPKKIESKEDWEKFFTQLANPSCNKCYGRGYVGWVVTSKKRDKEGVLIETKMPKGCTAKGCSLRNLQILQRQQKMGEMKDKQKKSVKSSKKENNERITH